MNTVWIYIVGPVLSALIDVAFERILKGNSTVAGEFAVQCKLDIDNSENP